MNTNYEKNKVTTNEDKENSNTENMIFKKDDFVLIKLIYNRVKKPKEKYFIAQIKEVETNNYTCKFMRKGHKSENTFIFPNIENEMKINRSEVIRKLLPTDIRRGRHIFKDIVGVQF